MKNKTKYMMLGICSLAGIACACSSDDTQQQETDSRREIQLKAHVGQAAVTRATAQENIAVGATVWVWAEETDPSTKDVITEGYINAWELRSSPGGLLLPVRRTEKQHYPEENLLNFYGLSGNFRNPAITSLTTPYGEVGTLTHYITADQTDAEKVEKNDLLCGSVKDITPDDYNANIRFFHLLTQVNVALIAKANNEMGPDQANELQSATVKLLGVKKSIQFTPLAKDADFSDPAVRLSALSDNGAETQSIDIATAANAYGSTYKYATAIIPPMTLNGDFIEVVFKGKTYHIAFDKELESGKSYVMNLLFENNATFTASTVEVSSWTAKTSNRPVELIYPTSSTIY